MLPDRQGIDIDHPDLNVVGVCGSRAGIFGRSYDDDYSHGTHVAARSARDDDRGVVGVAPGARLWAVKVLDSQGVGYTSCVISGLNWVAGRKAEFNDGPGDGDPGINFLVANMSLGGRQHGPLYCDCQRRGAWRHRAGGGRECCGRRQEATGELLRGHHSLRLRRL
jgi:subtilisin family serine protease